MREMNLKVVFAGGGTGGHVIPAIAVANEIVYRGGTVRFIGSSDRLEARLVPKAGYGIDFIKVKPLVGMGAMGFIRGLASVPAASIRAAGLIKKLKPDVVLGVGGYVAGPVVLAAKLKGVPSAVLEQNATVGLTNKILARVIDRAFVSYEETAHMFRSGRVEFTGNPVDRSIIEASKGRVERTDGIVRVVVMGGSQGAKAIDERVPEALEKGKLQGEVEILHQSSPSNIEKVMNAYTKAGVTARVVSFLDDMAQVYAEADLVIARSGATTIAELTTVGLPAVLLPYPHHSDKQQERNAKRMVEVGAALVLDEKQTGVKEMADAICEFVRDKKRRNEAAVASACLGHPEAAAKIADGLETLAGVRV